MRGESHCNRSNYRLAQSSAVARLQVNNPRLMTPSDCRRDQADGPSVQIFEDSRACAQPKEQLIAWVNGHAWSSQANSLTGGPKKSWTESKARRLPMRCNVYECTRKTLGIAW